MTVSAAAILRAILALAGAVILLRARVRSRRADRALALVALLAAAGWWNDGLFRSGSYLHVWQLYHYYVGGKYFRELQYERLYQCTAVAERELGVPGASTRRIRRLDGAGIEAGDPGARYAAPCHAAFAPARWNEFRRDIGWFARSSPDAFAGVTQDHGYNPTPVWTLLWGSLAGLAPPSVSWFRFLSLLDVGFLVAAAAGSWRAFGLRAAATLVLFWAALDPAGFQWVGGGLVRFDWFAAVVLAVSAMKRQRPALAGFLLGYASLVRIFPILLLGGALAALVGVRRRPRLRFALRRAALGFAFAGILFIPPATLATRSPLAADPLPWSGFALNSSRMTGAPMFNSIGLRVSLSLGPEQPLLLAAGDDPIEVWWRAKADLERSRRPVWIALAASFVVLLAAAAARAPLWAACALGAGLAPTLLVLPGYYAAVLAPMTFLARLRPAAGSVLLVAAAGTSIAPLVFRFAYHQYVLDSALLWSACLASAGLLAFRRRRPRAITARTQPTGPR